MKPALRQGLVYGLLALTLAASFWPESQPERVVAVAPRPAPASGTPATNAAAPAPAPAGDAAGKAGGEARAAPASPDVAATEAAARRDLFPAQTWAPPPLPQAPVKPPPPEPPPLNVSFAGRYLTEGRTLVFLLEGDKLSVAGEGAQVGPWTLKEITPLSLVFHYPPLNATRTLTISELRP
ncbi:MAG: hypothetical protein RIR00_2352 [Pseudomonadota bacterium]|jgi:hypothetical protein